jgi:hypothetical protein
MTNLNYTVETTMKTVIINFNGFLQVYSNDQFTVILFNNQRIDGKTFYKNRRCAYTQGYAQKLIDANKDVFNLK